MKVLLTSGGTKVRLDEVRNIGNMSNGTFGDHICRALLAVGQNVQFLYAKGSKAPHEFRADLRNVPEKMVNIKRLIERMEFIDQHSDQYEPVEYYDFQAYHDNLVTLLKSQPDVVILAAAVSDFTPVTQASGKISSYTETMSIQFVQTPKLIKLVKTICPNCFLVGFKLLVGSTDLELEAAMSHQIERSGCDMVVGNDIRDIRGNNHKLTLMYKGGSPVRNVNTVQHVSNQPGASMAAILVQRIIGEMTLKATAEAGEGETR